MIMRRKAIQRPNWAALTRDFEGVVLNDEAHYNWVDSDVRERMVKNMYGLEYYGPTGTPEHKAYELWVSILIDAEVMGLDSTKLDPLTFQMFPRETVEQDIEEYIGVCIDDLALLKGDGSDDDKIMDILSGFDAFMGYKLFKYERQMALNKVKAELNEVRE